MEKEFVPYELAVKLKELGFEFESLGAYLDKELFLWQDNDTTQFINFNVEAPLWQQAFDWFRENHSLPSWCFKSDKWWYKIENGDWWYGNTYDEACETYQESRQSCLEKLIELIQNKNDRSI